MKTFCFSIITLLVFSHPAISQIAYVTQSGNGLQNGTSWTNAYNASQLQAAINQSGITEVWVAAGTYKPTTTTDRTISFSMKNGVTIYGGFDGIETLSSQRNWTTNATILSGDIGILGNNSDNSYHVVYNSALNNTAVLDGFQIMNGYAFVGGLNNEFGGGMVNQSASPIIRNCSFTNNTAFSDSWFALGGAIYNNQSSPTIDGCSFTGNLAKVQEPVPGCGCTLDALGGAIFSAGGEFIISRCSFTSNQAVSITANAYAQGGAIYGQDADETITSCVFLNNSVSASQGGGYGQGGGIFSDMDDHHFIVNCTFYGNAANYGGGVYANNSSLLVNCILWANTADYSGAAGIAGIISTTSSIIQDDPESQGMVPLFMDPAGGNLRLKPCSAGINAGDNSYLFNSGTTDIDGNARVQQGTVDMGAYENSLSTPIASITPNSNIVICSNIAVNLTASGGVTYLWSTNATTNSISINTAGTYTVTVYDTYGCSSSTSVSATAQQGTTYYQDVDHDTYGNPSVSTVTCSGPPQNYVSTSGDCNDSDPLVFAIATWYLDSDNDGHYVSSQSSCGSPGAGYNQTSAFSGDCNDNDGSVWQSGSLYIDADQDGHDAGSSVVCYGNSAPAGFAFTSEGSDCNDADASLFATATWFLDADNDGHYLGSQVSCGSPGAGYNTTATHAGDCNDSNSSIWENEYYYIDQDGDFYQAGSELVCRGNFIPAGYVSNDIGADCDDNNPAIHQPQSYFVDGDLDGFGSTSTAMICSAVATSGYSTNNSDCNDADGSVHSPQSYYVDSDLDGFGSTSTSMVCSSIATSGYSINNTDCNDNDNTKWQSASLFIDNDDDNYNNGSAMVCYGSTIPEGYDATSSGSDCDDSNPAVHPGATDVCNNNDDNCDGHVDENGITASVIPGGSIDACSHTTVILTANTNAGSPIYQWYKGTRPISGATNSKYNTGGTQAGIFKVQVSGGFDCSAQSNQVTINRLSTPQATIKVASPMDNPDLCINGQVKLVANSSSTATLGYQWYFNNSPLIGATNKNYTVASSGDGAGGYKVTVTNSLNSCFRTSSVTNVISSCRVNAGTETESSLNIYPNPSDGYFVIELNLDNTEDGLALVQVFNTIGQLVNEENVIMSSGKLIKEMKIGENQPADLFLVKVIVNGGDYQGQVIYQR